MRIEVSDIFNIIKKFNYMLFRSFYSDKYTLILKKHNIYIRITEYDLFYIFIVYDINKNLSFYTNSNLILTMKKINVEDLVDYHIIYKINVIGVEFIMLPIMNNLNRNINLKHLIDN